MRVLLTTAMIVIMSGCTYNAKVSESALAVKANHGQKSPKGITLIDNRDSLQVSTFKVQNYTGNVDARDAFFDATKSMLGTVYSKVDVSMSAKPENELYAVASYDTKLPDPGPVTTMIVNDVKLEVYDTATKRPIHTFTASKEDRASGSPGLRMITGLTLFIISPITIPIETHQFGSEGEEIVTKNLKTALAEFRAKLAANP